MKHKLFTFITFTLMPLGIVAIAYLIYYSNLESKQYEFTRKLSFKLTDFKRADIKYNTYYFAGVSGKDIYLGNTTAPRHLLKINSSLKDTQSIFINLDTNYFAKNGSYRFHVDSANFYLYNGSARSLFSGRTGKWRADHSVPNIFFTEMLAVKNGSKVFKYVSENTRSYALHKIYSHGRKIANEQLFETQNDPLFSTSGAMAYAPLLNKLVYTFYYRNQVLLIDTNLSLVHSFKTIDPINIAKLKIGTIHSQNKQTVTSSDLVNARTAVWENRLYVHSKIMGQKEDETLFNHSAAIDVYDLKQQKYLYSFYLPHIADEPILAFQVYDGYIYTLSNHFINRFKFSIPAD